MTQCYHFYIICRLFFLVQALPWPVKDRAHFRQNYKRPVFQMRGRLYGYCNYSLLFYVIFCNLFSILIHLYCLHECLLKYKRSALRTFTNKSKGKCANFITMGKNSNTKRSKTVVHKCKTKSRHKRSEEGKILDQKRNLMYVL